MNNQIYTKEMEMVMSYMTDVLAKEYCTKALTPEYLITSLLDNKMCHAYVLLNKCLMSHNLNELKNIYIKFLTDNQTVTERTTTDNYSDELIRIFKIAEKEKEKTHSNSIGSEHILLSMLNPETNLQTIQLVFKNMGVDYDFLITKCVEKTNKRENKKINMQNQPNFFQLKSDVNPKNITNNKDKFIPQFTTSINQLVKDGKIDRLVGRQDEINIVTKILARRKKNNVILVGNSGCGTTSIVHGIAFNIIDGNAPDILKGKEIVQLNIMALVSGTHFRGMFEERVKGLFDELKSNKNYILFLDDIQQFVKTGTKEKDTDMSQMIGEILAEGDVRVIATTNFKDYKNGIEANSSLSRKFQKIVVEPTNIQETIEILKQNKQYYEQFHNVTYSNEVIEKTVELADRYITNRSLPDSAIDVLDLSGAYTCLIKREPDDIIEMKTRLLEINTEKEDLLNHGEFEKVDALSAEENELKLCIAEFSREYEKHKNKYQIPITIEHVASAVSDITKVPIKKLTVNEKQKIAHIEDILKESIIGQDDAINSICRIIKRNKIGLGDKTKTLGNVLMLGPSGVGKTLIAKKLAEEIFGSDKDLVRIDMSEYSEKSSVSKLIGASAGYIGFDQGGLLTEAVKNKQHCVLLLDEIEKANEEVFNLFLQLFDEGRLTDNSGQVVNFKNVIVLMTSNVGARDAAEMGRGIGFTKNENELKRSIIDKKIKNTFAPEFLNRIDNIIYFNSLTKDNLKEIVELELRKLQNKVHNLGYNIIWDNEVTNLITENCYNKKEYGARPLIRYIHDNIEDDLTNLLLDNEYEHNHMFFIKVINDKIIVQP